jgi:MoxR-like ATPase
MSEPSLDELQGRVDALAPAIQAIRDEVGRVLVGQRYMVDRLLIGLLAGGHLLLEGVPGLAKTTAVRSLAEALDVHFSRIQFTPDLLPADVLGTQIYNPREGSFSTRRGPIFANLVLADEINRAPAKVQSALLEAMQERQVTIGDQTFPLKAPFLVLATQNPIEQEGTYPLPEAQVDRFMLKLDVGYPSKDEELEILRRAMQPSPTLSSVCSAETILQAQGLVRELMMKPVVQAYIIEIVHATRHAGELDPQLGRYVQYGASPRASISLAAAARAYALLDGRAFVTPDDIKAIGPDVLRHRVLITYEAEAEGVSSTDVVRRILETVRTP